MDFEILFLGYGKGLYTAEELDGNYDNKDKKLVFL